MKTKDILRYIVEEMHTTVLATMDHDGKPVTCAIDMMDYDEGGLYFLTAKGKKLYERLNDHENIALTALKGEDTLSSVAVSLVGRVTEIGTDRLDDLFRKNPYMNTIYPSVSSRMNLTVFRIYEGSGEYFDLSKYPVVRAAFAFGNQKTETGGYYVNDRCTGCRKCVSVCPQKCIDMTVKPVFIQQEHCLHCGNCYAICPVKAIERK